MALFLTPFVIARLGDTGYGLWTLLGSLTGYIGLLDLGVRSAVTRYVAKLRVECGHADASRVISSALLFFAGVAVVAVLLSTTLALFVVDVFRIPDDYRPTVRLVLMLIGLNVAVTLVSGVFGAVIVGLQRFDVANGVEIVATSTRAILVVLALGAGGGLVALACVQLTLTLGRLMAEAWLSRRLYPQALELRGPDRAHLRLIFSHAVYAFLIHVSIQLIYYADSVVIGLFLPVSFVTFFAIGHSLLQQASVLAGGIRRTLVPLASSLEVSRHPTALARVALDGARYCTAVVLPVYVTFVLRGHSFIGLWLAGEYARPSGDVLAILTLGLAFGAGPGALGSMVLGTGRHRILALAGLGEALGNVGLSLLLVRPLGIIGVAWGTTIPALAMSCLFWPWFAQRSLGVSLPGYVGSMWGRPAVAIIPFAVITWALERWWPAPNLVVFFVQVALALPVAAACLWRLCVPPRDRERLWSQARGAWLVAMGRGAGLSSRPVER